ncbi:MAG TPA: DivIVA domain-containing protein [Acidimicrobiales bacterium]|jgi:DivIVA domain-containing protein|nr:DivIVA domain-containing protein [Acidimicrobiales bacterium]
MPEGRVPISSSRVSTGDISRHSFAIVRRGFDVDEVKAYLQQVARIVEQFEEHEQELRAAVAQADERAAHPVVDEATLTASLGQHSAQILRHAHEEAARIVVQAQEGASTLLREAQSQANELQAQAEVASAQRVAELELMVATAEQEAKADVERIRAEAQGEREHVVDQAKSEGRALLEQVQEARRRVLSDLATRRRALSIQIEQLRAARDEMAAAVQNVRQSVDGILVDLSRTDDEARAAAAAAGDQARINTPRDLPGEEATEAPAEDDGAERIAEEGAGEPGHDGVTPSVDELFARLRAGADEPDATTVVPVSAPTSVAPVVVIDVEDDAEGIVAVTPIDLPADPPTDEVIVNPDDGLIAQRDELLSPVTTQLARHIKRALGDDQNRLLDGLRNAPSISQEALLGPEDLHLSTYTSAAQSQMAEAFNAGTVFAGAQHGRVAPSPAMEQSSAGLARTIVTMLRRRITEGGGEDMGERVGAAFREWRGERIDRLVGDYAVQAFSAGVVAAAPGGLVRWIMTAADGCSDCDDNALAEGVPVSEGFPTGHPYPPAHSGCRCLVAPASA